MQIVKWPLYNLYKAPTLCTNIHWKSTVFIKSEIRRKVHEIGKYIVKCRQFSDT